LQLKRQVAVVAISNAATATIAATAKNSGLLVKEFCTAENLLERRKGLVRFSRGSAKLDTFLNGGIETEAVTEIAVANLTVTSYDDIFDAYRSALEFYHHKSD
jgi:RecA/RadA recombinase